METLRKDLRYAFQMLVKTPGFTLIAALALGLGIGANTAIFSVFDGMLWRPLPAKNPNELVVVASKISGIDFPMNLSYRDFLDYRDLKQVFADAAAMIPSPLNLGVNGSAERAWTEFVSGNMFSMLGLQPAVGRFFAPDEGWAKGKDPLMILSYKFWQSRFGGDRGVIGKTVLVQNRTFTIIGVAPKAFHGTYYFIDPDFYLPANMIPLMVNDADKFLEDRNESDFRILARLQPGVTPQQAKAAAAPLDARLAQEFPDSHKGFQLQIYPELKARPEPGLVADFMPKLVAVFMSLVGLVLLIACANVANLILVRANGRSKEIATRTAMGASTWRITRQLLTESVLLSMVGGTVGVVIARWAALGLMAIHVPSDVPLRLFDLRMDYRMFAFCFLVAVLTGVAAGIIPALRTARANLAETLKEGGRSGSSAGSHNRVRNALVVAQVAVSLLLLAGAGFFVRSFENSANTDMGFRVDHTLMASMDLRLQNYTEQRGQQFYEQLRDRVKAHSGVRDAAVTALIPMGYDTNTVNVYLEGEAADKSKGEIIFCNSVQPDYFRTLGVRLLQGREFTKLDNAAAPRVAIVNEAFAKKMFRGQDPLGKTFQTDRNGPKIQIVGETSTGKYLFLYEPPQPFIYFPMAQKYQSSATLLVYSEGDPQRMAAAVREEARQLDSTLPLYDVMTMDSHVRYGKPLLPARLCAMLVGAFGLLGLLLASVGVYGVIAYSVSQRTQELGIRAALGARPRNVITLVLRQGMTLSLIGLGIGVTLAFLMLRAMHSVLYGVGSTDFPTLGAVSLLLLAVAFVASYIPALRATKVDPVVALRHE